MKNITVDGTGPLMSNQIQDRSEFVEYDLDRDQTLKIEGIQGSPSNQNIIQLIGYYYYVRGLKTMTIIYVLLKAWNKI